jgi:hypothetical protein
MEAHRVEEEVFGRRVLIEPADLGEVRAGESRVGHIVFRLGYGAELAVRLVNFFLGYSRGCFWGGNRLVRIKLVASQPCPLQNRPGIPRPRPPKKRPLSDFLRTGPLTTSQVPEKRLERPLSAL